MKLGRILITFVLFNMMVGPILVHWNHTHVFNPAWPPHARFHTVLGDFMMLGYAVVALWLVWRRSVDQGTGVCWWPLWYPSSPIAPY